MADNTSLYPTTPLPVIMPFDFGFFSTLGNLLFRYMTEATVFCLAHAGLAFLVWRIIREINEETENLNRWNPDNESQGTCADLLSQFVHEARSGGEKGVVTPMTDFSDRLDSHVNGLEESLHNRINFFVVIGIAGTFFALFQFAQKTSDGPKDAEAITNLLRTSLSNAFPVGFAGLFLTITAYFISQSRVDQLKDAVSRATSKALGMREHWMTSPATHIQKALNEELAPLRNLDVTLGDKLQPIMEKFREQLAESSELVANKVAPLGSAAASLQASTATLSGSMDRVAAAADCLPAALEHVESLQRKAVGMVQEMERSFKTPVAELTSSAESLHAAAGQLERCGQVVRETVVGEMQSMVESASTVLRQSAEEFSEHYGPIKTAMEVACSSIQSAAGALTATPDRLVSTYAQRTEELTNRLGEQWQRTGARLLEGLQQHHLEVLHNIREEAERVASAMNASALKMREAAENVELTMQLGVRTVASETVKRIEPQLIELRDGLAAHLRVLQISFSSAATSAAGIENQTRRTLDSFREIAEILDVARERWLQITDKLEKASNTLESASLGNTLQQIAADVRNMMEGADSRRPGLKTKPPRFWVKVKLLRHWLTKENENV